MIDHGTRSTRRFDVPSEGPQEDVPLRARAASLGRGKDAACMSAHAMQRWGEYRDARAPAGIYLLFCVGNKSAPESVSSRSKHNNLR